MTNREKIIRIFLIAVVPFIIFVWMKNFGILRGRSKAKALDQVTDDGGVPQTQTLARRTRKSEYPEWGRDPFFAGQASRGAALGLQGIVMDPLSPFAIINGEVIKEGETIGGATVVLIQKTKVILKKGKEEIVLELFQQ